MREIVLGTAGHVDHGKTSFVRALTGIETDRLKEEKKRGITIELGFAYLDLPCGHRLGIVDVPGHEKFVKNMVAGVTGMDLVAFIVAADEGIMPQTKEHFEICHLLGVKQGIVVITKKDMVEEEWLEMVTEEVQEFFEGSFLEDAPIVHVSSVSGDGIDKVRDLLDAFVSKQQFNEAHGPFRLSVDRIFAIKGFGAVVTGTSISGRVSIGDELCFYPTDLTAKVRGVQVHSKDVETVEAGHRTAINLQGVDTAVVSRGMVAATPGCLAPGFMLDCDFLYLASNTKPLKHRTRVRVHLGTVEIMGRISLLDRDVIQPGESAGVQLLLEEAVSCWPGDRYVVRSYSPVATIGGGEVLGNMPPRKRKRLNAQDQENNKKVFKILSDEDVEGKILLFLRESGTKGLTFNELGVRLGIFSKQLKKLISTPLASRKMVVVDSTTQRYLVKSVTDDLEQTLMKNLESFHAANPLQLGLSKEALRSGLGRNVDVKVFQFCLGELQKKDLIIQEDSAIRLATHKVALQADEQKLQKDLENWYREKGLKTATIRETMDAFSDYPETLVKEVFSLLIREEKLVKVSETLYYDAAVIATLQKDVIAFMEKEGEIDAPRFKNLTGLTRKFSIPLLEYFDRMKLTIRVGDVRIFRKQ